MAKAFIKRGASIFVGIDKKVDASYLDKIGLELVKEISQGHDVKEAVSSIMERIGPDPISGARLLYYTKD
mgnify:FL=1